MPRRSNAQAKETRAAIIDRAVATASIEGLEGVTIGRLADDLGMSKAGVVGHFGTKSELQRAALREAQAIFTRDVWEPSAGEAPGLVRLRAVGENWVRHLSRCPFPGGCFMTTVSTEWDAREGPVRDDVREGFARWRSVLRDEAATAVKNGELPADSDPDQIAFELLAIAMGLNQAVQLFKDRRAPARARRAIARLLDAE